MEPKICGKKHHSPNSKGEKQSLLRDCRGLSIWEIPAPFNFYQETKI
jgi:hypothetical protein